MEGQAKYGLSVVGTLSKLGLAPAFLNPAKYSKTLLKYGKKLYLKNQCAIIWLEIQEGARLMTEAAEPKPKEKIFRLKPEEDPRLSRLIEYAYRAGYITKQVLPKLYGFRLELCLHSSKGRI